MQLFQSHASQPCKVYFASMKHQIVALVVTMLAALPTLCAQDSRDSVQALALAQAWTDGGSTNDLAAVTPLLPSWDAFYTAFQTAIGGKLESEVSAIRAEWRTESFCDEWLRTYRQSCHEAGLEFMHAKATSVTDLVCGSKLGEGVHETVCNAEVSVVDGRGQKATMVMLVIRDQDQLWLADAATMEQ